MFRLAKSYQLLQVQAKSPSYQVGSHQPTQLIHSILMQCKPTGMLVRLVAWMLNGGVPCSLTDQGGVTFQLVRQQPNGYRLIHKILLPGLSYMAALGAI